MIQRKPQLRRRQFHSRFLNRKKLGGNTQALKPNKSSKIPLNAETILEMFNEISMGLAHKYSMKAIKHSKDLESGHADAMVAGDKKIDLVKHFRKVGNRAVGIKRAQRRIAYTPMKNETVNELTARLLKRYRDEASVDVERNNIAEPRAEKRARVKKRLHGMDLAKKKIHNETLAPNASSGTYIHDFVHSTNSRFKGKSKKERIRMALGAFYGKHKR